MLSVEEIKQNKEKIVSLLRSTGRDGIDKVIDYLEKNDFFIMPSSLHRHHNWEGGLAQHCLGVFERLNKTGKDLPENSVIITSFLHDICKTGKIYKGTDGEWHEKLEEELDIPGHGDRSVKLLDKLDLQLSSQEKGAIKWHMGGWKIGEKTKEEIKDFFSTKKSDLWRLLHNADRFDASHNSSAEQIKR